MEVGGRRLACADCHQRDASGAFLQRFTYEANCRGCHSLNFDERNPGMTLPHGDAAFVRAYLQNLPSEYADYATRVLGLANKREVAAFVSERLSPLEGVVSTSTHFMLKTYKRHGVLMQQDSPDERLSISP